MQPAAAAELAVELEIPAQNFLPDPHEPHAEILDTTRGEVWQSQQPITPDQFRGLDLPEGFRPIGLGTGTMDLHYFRRSPGASGDGAVAQRDFSGHTFTFCAKPPADGPSLPAGGKGPRLLMVDKHHSLIFEPGRRVEFLVLPDGSEYVHVIDPAPGTEPLELPEGWTVRSVELAEQWVVHLPAPTKAFFFPGFESFQGPIAEEAMP